MATLINRSIGLVLVASFTVTLSASVLADSPRDSNTTKVARQTLPSVVRVARPIKGEVDVVGSGFIIDGRGYILTNEHVIAGENAILVGLFEKKSWLEAEVIFSDKGNDLAVLKVEVEKLLPELRLGPSSDLEVGEPAIVIGNPLDETFTVTQGIISKLNKRHERADEHKNMVPRYLIQTDAAINPGNSGGPLLNANGEVVGIVELKKGSSGLGWAITADRAQRILAQAMSAEKKAKVKHGIKAVELKVLSRDGKDADRRAVVIKEIASGSPAAQVETPASNPQKKEGKAVEEWGGEEMGAEEKAAEEKTVEKKEAQTLLRQGDRIVKVDGRLITNAFDLERAFWDKKPGDKITVNIRREGKEMNVTLCLAGDGIVPEIKD